MPVPDRPVAPLKQATADNEAAQKRAVVNKINLQGDLEFVFSSPRGMRIYGWLMDLCGLYSSNSHQNSNVYRQEAQRDIANTIRKVSPGLHIQWLKGKEAG